MTRPAPGTPPPSGPAEAAEDYLAEISARLPGPARARAGIVAELRAGLLDATDAYARVGRAPAEAAAAAIAEFGDPAQVAAGFGAEIAAGQARRVAVALLATGPLVGLLWVATALASHLGVRVVLPWQWTGAAPAVALGLHLVVVAVVLTAWAALLSIAVTGRLTRWLPARPRRAPTAAAVAGFGAVGADALGLALLAVELATGAGRISPLWAAAAAAASVARLLLARRAARRCLAVRASLA